MIGYSTNHMHIAERFRPSKAVQKISINVQLTCKYTTYPYPLVFVQQVYAAIRKEIR